MRILATNGLEPEGVDLLQKSGFDVDVRNGCTEEELIQIAGSYDALIIRTATKITKKILENRGNLKIICCATAGVNNVDIDAATEHDVAVMYVPGGNANAVAELVLGFIFAISRNIIEAHNALQNGEWIKSKMRGEEILGKTLGIVGLGNIGTLLAQKAASLGMNIVAHDPFIARSDIAEMISLPELLARADFISLHATLTDATQNIISEKEIAAMKRGASIINCARGELIDDTALKDALSKGVIRAALDVYRNEPKTDGALGDIDRPLTQLSSITTPHIAGSSAESRRHIAIQCAKQMAGALLDDNWENTVNLPPAHQDLKPYMYLAYALGAFAAKLWFVGEPKRFSEIRFIYSRELKNYNTQILAQSSLQGLISSFSSEGPIGLVNASAIAKKRGLKISRTTHDDPLEYANLLAMELLAKNGERHRIEGIVVGAEKIRIVRIDDFPISIEPAGNMLVFENNDEVGVLHNVTGILAKHAINIEDMSHKANVTQENTALGIIIVSKVPDRAVLSLIEDLKTVRFIKLISF